MRAQTTGTSSRRPADQVSLRRHNLSVVVRHLREHGPRSRARIAADTGLNKATVSSIVAELVERRLITSGEAEHGAIGRPGRAVELDDYTICGIGAEINVDYVSVTAIDLRGQVIVTRRHPVDAARAGTDVVLDAVAALVASVRDLLAGQARLEVGLVLGVPGLVDARAGILRNAANLGWADLDLAGLLTQRLGAVELPIQVDNEANLAAIAEHSHRHGAVADLILLTGAVGVGAGIVSDGRLVRGHAGHAGEAGHMPVELGGGLCGCGRRGCWETRVGLWPLLHALADIGDEVLDPSLDVEQRLAEVVSRAESGDRRTLDALAQVGSWLGVGASTLANIVDPALIVLGGHLATVGPWVLAPMRRELASRVIGANPHGGPTCEVEISPLGVGAAALGAAEVALDALFDDPTLAPRVVGVDAAGA